MTKRGPRAPAPKANAADAGRRLVIAIDGPAGAGKSTAARALAAALGYTHIDSGAMYRLVALAARERGIDPDDADALARLVASLDFALRRDGATMRVLLEGRDVSDAIRAPAVAEDASRVAAVPAVRRRLVERQRALAAHGGVVMDGRDIGTVVFPDADRKFFVTASTVERARRRQAETAAGGQSQNFDATRADLEARDRRDRERGDSPLRAADDAIIVDTSALAPNEVLERMLESVRSRASS